ncbi:MAG: glycosyltransferase [Flavobacteriales bacterium]
MIEYLQENIWGVSGGALFLLAWLVQVFYLLGYYLKAAKKTNSESNNHKPVSIVISARNEEKNLIEHIPAIMEQDYPNFEVVVVNDSSWDDTQGILKALQVRYNNLHVVNLDEEKQNMQGKKFALTLGIKAAKHDIILLTDADCVPTSNHWIRQMTAQINEQHEIVLGVSPYRAYPGWLNKIIRFDTLMIAASYIGFAKAGKPYMGVGRNLCYSKDAFFKVGGFRNHYSIASGDDDLFINQVATSRNTLVVVTPEAHTTSEPKRSWNQWFRQKRRHLTTTPHYKAAHKRMLAIWPATFLLMYAGLALAIVFQTAVLILSGVLLLRYIILLFTLHKVTTRLAMRKDLVWLAPILEPYLHVLNLGLYLTNLIRKQQKWN